MGKEDESYSITEAYVNRDPNQYKEKSLSYDAKLLLFLIDNLLLGKDHPFPMPDNLPYNFLKGLYQHHIAGTGYREVEVEHSTKGRRAGWLRRWLTNLFS